jgi:hypothetical protein
MDERFIKRLMASIKCGVCGQPYKKANIKVIGHQEDFWFLNVHCSTCQSHALVAAVVREDTAPEIVTDLTEKEYASFSQANAVESDDVLEIHQFLESFEGDFSLLFSKE